VSTFYRHEYKKIIQEGEVLLLSRRLAPLMARDRHGDADGGYWSRSLYFDDYSFHSLLEKIDGVSDRSKYRLRLYNYDNSRVSLELKQKRDHFIHKESVVLTPGEVQQILSGAGAPARSEKRLLRRFALAQRRYGLKPVQLVDYYRQAFVAKAGNVRVTFDRHLSAPLTLTELTDAKIPRLPALPPSEAILEIKYDGFLPLYISELLRLNARETQAASKYVLCCQANSRKLAANHANRRA